MLVDRVRSATARISITVTEFHEIGSKHGCSRADIELTDTGNGTVSQARINDPIVVHAEVYVEFSVHAGADDRHSYAPIGIGFRETTGAGAKQTTDSHCDEGGGRDPLGHAAFPVRATVSRGDTAQLTVLDANPEPGEFEFSLIIQRSDGLLSVVDPTIKNRGVWK